MSMFILLEQEKNTTYSMRQEKEALVKPYVYIPMNR